MSGSHSGSTGSTARAAAASMNAVERVEAPARPCGSHFASSFRPALMRLARRRLGADLRALQCVLALRREPRMRNGGQEDRGYTVLRVRQDLTRSACSTIRPARITMTRFFRHKSRTT